MASSSSRRLTFSITLEEARGSLLLNQEENIASLPNGKGSKDSGSGVKEEGPVGGNEGIEMKKIETSDVKSEVNSEGKCGGKDGKDWKKRGNLVNKDHSFLVTNDPRQDFAFVLEAAVLLESQELHTLSITHKLAVLKAICDACYDTQRLTELLASNAEERAERATAMNKKIREDKAKSKEVSIGRTASAVERCREINILAAAEVNKSTKGPKAKGWKMHDPTPTQVQICIISLCYEHQSTRIYHFILYLSLTPNHFYLTPLLVSLCPQACVISLLCFIGIFLSSLANNAILDCSFLPM